MVYIPIHREQNKKWEEEKMKEHSLCRKHVRERFEKVEAVKHETPTLSSLPIMLIDFSEALKKAKLGGKIARRGWNNKDMWIEIQYPDTYSKMNLPYLYLRTADGRLVPYTPTQEDILADDWMVVGHV